VPHAHRIPLITEHHKYDNKDIFTHSLLSRARHSHSDNAASMWPLNHCTDERKFLIHWNIFKFTDKPRNTLQHCIYTTQTIAVT